MDKVRASFLGYKSNKGMIEFLKQMMILEEVSNTSYDIFTDMSPVFFVEEGSKTIRAKCFKRA
jgi:hypothetical protein